MQLDAPSGGGPASSGKGGKKRDSKHPSPASVLQPHQPTPAAPPWQLRPPASIAAPNSPAPLPAPAALPAAPMTPTLDAQDWVPAVPGAFGLPVVNQDLSELSVGFKGLADEQRLSDARTLRKDALGEKGEKHGKVKRMTYEQYAALDPMEKAAIDFNTMLVRAVRKDKHNQEEYDPTPAEVTTYDDTVERLFGEDRGSKLYAPETLGVLDQIKFRDESADLDDFLKLKAAITKRDLKNIEAPSLDFISEGLQPAPTEPAPARADLTQMLASRTQLMLQESLDRGNQLLQTTQQTAAVNRNEAVTLLGGFANTPAAAPGYGAAVDEAGHKTMDGYFQESLEALARDESARDASTDKILSDMRATLSRPGEFEKFLAYADSFSANAQRFDDSLGAVEGVQYRTPEQFRELLGLAE